MYLAHDPTLDFWYYGKLEPRPGMFTEFIVNADPKIIGFDIETISLKERIAIGCSIAPNSDMAFYFPLFPEVSPAMPWGLLKDPDVTKVLQNAPFDLMAMREFEIYNGNVADTNVMAHLLNIKPSRLVDIMAHVALTGGPNYEVHEIKEILPAGKTMLDLDRDTVAKKCCQDSLATLVAYGYLLPQVDYEYFSVEMEVIPILVEMSFKGILLDQEVRAMLEENLEDKVDYYSQLCEAEGFMPSSPQQVGYVLAKRGAYWVFTRLPFTKGSKRKQLRTDEETLSKMDDPLAALVLNFRKESKLLNTYIKPWAKEERATTRFHLDAVTGRPSSTERNLQNIPKGEPRGMFIPDSDCFTDIDFSQMELRLLAYFSGDREMQYIFNLPRNLAASDIHQATADFLGIPRGVAKNTNFAMIYGATDYTIAEVAKVRSIARAHQLKEMWFEKFPQAGDYIDACQRRALEYPYATTLFGRKIRLPTVEEESEDRIMRKAVNYPIQGSAAEILKRALIKCKDLPMLLQVHDEILFDGKVDLPDLEHIAPLYTPIDVKYIERWE